MKEPTIRLAPLATFRPQRTNANAHTERGMGLLEHSMRQDGFFDGMTATVDGEIIDGSARLEKAAEIFEGEALVIEHDGTRPLIEVRTDIQTADDPRAKRIALAANRVAQVNLKFDAQVLKGLQNEIDLTPLWTPEEMRTILQPAPLQQHGSSDQSGLLTEHFNILIECKTEHEQRELLERLTEEGVQCRSLIS